MAREILPVLLTRFDEVTSRLRYRLDGLSDTEYLWEPVPGVWTVRAEHDGWQVDEHRYDLEPAPVTTIAWRLWHIASDCLASYVYRLGGWPLEVSDRQWYGRAEPALRTLDEAIAAFHTRITALGEDGAWRPLGPDWGEHRDQPWIALVVHALDEVSHHAAEIALLRDLYPQLHPDRAPIP
jgi:hypothetical protein